MCRPKRGRTIVAKLLVVALFSALIGLFTTGAAVIMKHAALGEHGLAPSEFKAAMVSNLGGVVLNYTLIGSDRRRTHVPHP